MSQWNLGVIGAGNMATAIIRGILKDNFLNPQRIHIYDIDKEKQSQLAETTSVSIASSTQDLIKKCSIILLAVKPQVFDNLLDEIEIDLEDRHILVSIAAGISTKFIKENTKNKCKVVRVMPNTPTLVGEGMSVICNNHGLNRKEIEKIYSIFSSLGKIEEVNEELINGVTAISGSSPAYVYLFIEAMADGGVLLGLPRDQAYRMAAQSVLGAAKMVIKSGHHPGLLKDKVCSPGGTTIEAVHTLEKGGFRGIIMDAVKDCALKAANIGSDET